MSNISTPMGCVYRGLRINSEYENVVISTINDYSCFANGVAKAIKNAYRGYMDFGEARGNEIYKAPIRSMNLPEVSTKKPVGYIIIAKSVVATGCTAISLVKQAYVKYMPKGIIIVSPFFGERGLGELVNEFPNADIYVGTEVDNIDENGMLIPGVGDIDKRLNKVV